MLLKPLLKSFVALRTVQLFTNIRLMASAKLETSSMMNNGNDPEDYSIPSLLVKQALRRSDAVCFDVDSTVISEEGIDVLAEYCGVGNEVAQLTKDAMEGGMKFEDALEARLDIIRPSRNSIANCLKAHPFRLSPGIKDLVNALHDNGKHVYLVSGGFHEMITPVATTLDIPRHRIYANRIKFDNNGTYSTYDNEELTCRDGGKAAVIERLKKEYGYNAVIMIGDGATDLQARPPADAFIGYGGVSERQNVKEGADWYVKDFKYVTNILTNKNDHEL